MSMSRTTKSVAAVGAGVLLLTAAGGTFARWSESETVDGGTITAGHLNMTVESGQWYDTTDGTKLIDPIADFHIVPGDVLEYRSKITPDLVGDNLEATLDVDDSAATGTMLDHVDVTTTLDGAATQVITPATTTDGITYNAVVRIEMPYGTRTNPDKGEKTTLDLSGFAVSLTQNPNPKP